jgi:hypothetical protein
MHNFPQSSFPISLARKKRQVYLHSQIEPGSLKNLTAQLKEGAAVARPLRPQCFSPTPSLWLLPNVRASTRLFMTFISGGGIAVGFNDLRS